MIRVLQTTFDEQGGDCISACVASILELPLSEVPKLRLDLNDWSWIHELGFWLAPSGMTPLVIGADLDYRPNRDTFTIACGPLPDGTPHAVVWKDGVCFSPSNKPLSSRGAIFYPKYFVLFVSTDPGAFFQARKRLAETMIDMQAAERYWFKLGDGREAEVYPVDFPGWIVMINGYVLTPNMILTSKGSYATDSFSTAADALHALREYRRQNNV